MVLSGEMTEDYREIKPYWIARMHFDIWNKKPFDAVQFYNGAYFSDKLPNFLIECNGIEIRTGKPEWGAVPDTEYFVIKLGKIIQNNTTVTN